MLYKTMADSDASSPPRKKRAEIRHVDVCKRCRSRKVKCDPGLPRCRPCSKVGATCIVYDKTSGQEVPRGHVSNLERRVQELEEQLAQYQSGHHRSRPADGESSADGAALGRYLMNADSPVGDRMRSASVEQDQNDNQNQYQQSRPGSSSNQEQNQSEASAWRIFTDTRGMGDNAAFDPFEYANVFEADDYNVSDQKVRISRTKRINPVLPDGSVVVQLLDHYFDRINPQVPVLEKDAFLEQVVFRSGLSPKNDGESSKRAMQSPLSPWHGRLIYIVLALGTACKVNESLSTSHAYFEAAMYYARQCNEENKAVHSMFGIVGRLNQRLENLQFSLLLALYSMMRPVGFGIWNTVGRAVRKCLALALHQDAGLNAPGRGEEDTIHLLQQETRRLFWCTYCLDRYICINMRMPLSFSDACIKTDLPWLSHQSEKGWAARVCMLPLSSTDRQAEYRDLLESVTEAVDKNPSTWVSLAFVKLRQLQSEIYYVLSETSGTIPPLYHSKAAWLQDIRHRLETWWDFSPSREDLQMLHCGFAIELLELNYLQARLLMYSLDLHYTTMDCLDELEDCAVKAMRMICHLEEKGFIHFTWITSHNLFVASVLYLFCTWQKVTTSGLTSYESLLGKQIPKSQEVETLANAVSKCLSSIAERSSAGLRSRRALQNMFRTSTDLVLQYEEKENSGSRAAEWTTGKHSWLQELKRKKSENASPPSTLPNSSDGGRSTRHGLARGSLSDVHRFSEDRSGMQFRSPFNAQTGDGANDFNAAGYKESGENFNSSIFASLGLPPYPDFQSEELTGFFNSSFEDLQNIFCQDSLPI